MEEVCMSHDARELIARYCPDFPRARCGRIYTDTSQFMDIHHGDLIDLGGLHYLVLRDEAERRFGMEDPKFWVKRCRVLETGERKILKLVFYEDFMTNIGGMSVRCFRSPQKESRILDLVRGDMRFMQGFTVLDEVENPVRVLDIVQGRRVDLVVDAIAAEHPAYFRDHFPAILGKYIEACEAIALLHRGREKHGDVRRDHLYQEFDSKKFCWIDFDYTFEFHENPFGLDLFGLGNILIFLVGKGCHTMQALTERGLVRELRLTPEDFALVLPNRLVNLRKLFPYIPEALHHVLMRFAAGTEVFYDSVEELLDDLRPCLAEMG